MTGGAKRVEAEKLLVIGQQVAGQMGPTNRPRGSLICPVAMMTKRGAVEQVTWIDFVFDTVYSIPAFACGTIE